MQISKKKKRNKQLGIDWNYVEATGQSGENSHFNSLSLLIHEHMVTLH